MYDSGRCDVRAPHGSSRMLDLEQKHQFFMDGLVHGRALDHFHGKRVRHTAFNRTYSLVLFVPKRSRKAVSCRHLLTFLAIQAPTTTTTK